MDRRGTACRRLPDRGRDEAEPHQRAAGRLRAELDADVGGGTIKVIGALEVLAAVGLILPALLGIAPVLVPLAALGIVALMIGATLTHLRRNEGQMIAVNVVLLLLAAVVAWGRFAPYNFAS